MFFIKSILQNLRSLCGGDKEHEIDEEIRFHMEMRTSDNITAGMSPEEARQDALNRFGNIEHIKNVCCEINEGDSLKNVLSFSPLFLLALGFLLLAYSSIAQVAVLGKMFIIIAILFQLLNYVRASRPVKRKSILYEGKLAEQDCNNDEMSSINQMLIHPKTKQSLIAFSMIIALLCTALLCIATVTSSATGLTTHFRNNAGSNTTIEKFKGTWVATFGSLYDTKENSVPPFMQNLPRDLPFLELNLKADGNKLTGTRIIYVYKKSSDGSAPSVQEKAELDLLNIKLNGNVLSGGVQIPGGEELPGIWEMKLLSNDEAEVRVSGDKHEQEMKIVLKVNKVKR